MKQQDEQLKLYKVAYSQLQNSFKNNLNVIKELQQENNQLQNHLQQVGIKYEAQLQRALIQQQEKHNKEIQEQEMQFGRQIELVKKEYENLISSINEKMEQKNQQLLFTLTKKHRNDTEGMRLALCKELQTRQMQLKKFTSRCKSLQQSLISTQAKLNASNVKILALESQLQRLSSQKKQTQTLYSSYQQQLQTLKQSSNSWEDILKSRIKELQIQKSSLQEQMAELKFTQKQKHKKLIQQHNKKITQLEQSHTNRLNQTLLQSKEINFKFQSINHQNIELKNIAENAKKQMFEAKRLLEQQKLKYVAVQDSLLTLKEKEYEIRSLNEEIKRLKSQCKIAVDEKDKLRQDCEKVNYQRENAEKALQRLKVELINKTKQSQESKKELQKMKYKTQINTFKPTQVQIGRNDQNTTNTLLNKQGKKEPIKREVDYSQCFTEDMGPVDQNFFMMNSGAPSPQKPNIQPYDQIHQDNLQDTGQQNQQSNAKIAHLMKRIGQLQVENNEYKSAIKTLKQEMERTSFLIEDKLSLKDKQIRLSKDQNLMLRQKLHDREEQLMTLKDSIKSMKEQVQRSKQSAKQLRQVNIFKEDNQKLTKQNKQLNEKILELKQEVDDAIKQRETLQQIADQLRTEVNFYKDQINYYVERENRLGRSHSMIQGKSALMSNNSRTVSKLHQHSSSLQNQYLNNFSNNYSQNTQNQPKSPMHYDSKNKPLNIPKNIPTRRYTNENPSNIISSLESQPKSKSKSKSKSPKQNQKPQNKPIKRKLHELIKQKNQLETQNPTIMGRKATIEKKIDDERPQHVGTKSQREIYQRLERISKSRSKQKRPSKLKDFQIHKPDRQFSVNKNEFLQQREQIKQTQLRPENNSISQVEPSREQEQEQISPTEMINRMQMINKIRDEMGNDSLGEFDHLENVSLTYWEQQY